MAVNRRAAAVVLFSSPPFACFHFALIIMNKTTNIKQTLVITGIMGDVVFVLRMNNRATGLICSSDTWTL